MISIKNHQSDSNDFRIASSIQSVHWITRVSEQKRYDVQQAVNVNDLYGRGRVLANEVAQYNENFVPDIRGLQNCLQVESKLDTNEPDVPWELMACRGNNATPSFWATEQPVVRVYGQPLSIHEPGPGRRWKSCLIVASDPYGDLELNSTYEDEIKALIHGPEDNVVLWNPSRDSLIRAIASGYDLVIFIGHATYNPDDPQPNKYHLIKSDYLTPDDLRINLHGQPLVFFIACVAAQYNPQSMEPAARPAIGFMPACLDRGASAFIGPLWKINVNGGLWLVKRALQYLQSTPPGEALQLARQDAVEETPEDVTWAAFVIYQRADAIPEPLSLPRPPIDSKAESLWTDAIEQFRINELEKTIELLTVLERYLKSRGKNS